MQATVSTRRRTGVAVGAVAVAAILLSACGSDGTDPGGGGTGEHGGEEVSSGGTDVGGEPVNPLFAEVGDCFSEFPAMDGTAILSIEVLDCDAPHAGEVVDSVEIDDSAVGLEQVQGEAAEICARRVPKAVDTERVDPQAQIFYWAPDPTSWDNGNRTVLCGLGVIDGKTTGSVGLHGA